MKQVILENDFLRVVIVSESGGRTFNLIDKRTGWDHSAKTDGGLGLFWEMLWQQKSTFDNDWAGNPYTYSVSTGKDSASVTVERTGKTGSLQYLTLRKTYTLHDNSSALHVRYEYAVDPNAMQDILITPRFHHGPNDGAHKLNIYYCDPTGVVERPYDPGQPDSDKYIYDVTRGWFGWIIPSKKVGGVFDFDYKRLMCLFQWQGGAGFTTEWMFRSLKVSNGKNFVTDTTFLPIHGLNRIDGVGNELAGCFTIDSRNLRGLQLYSCRNRDVVIKISLDRLPSQKGLFSKTITKTIQADDTITVPLDKPITKEGTYVFHCRVETPKGKRLLEFERPITVGKSSAKYVMKPEQKRLGDPKEEFGKLSPSTANSEDPYSYTNAIPSNGVRWCRPYTEGKIHLLAIVDILTAREAIELAERMDADLSMCTFSGSIKTSWTSFWGHSGGNAEMNGFLSKMLEKNYDCILVGGMNYEGISPKNMTSISQKVKAGAGFVSVMPKNVPEQYADLFPAKSVLTSYRPKDLANILVSNDITATKDSEFFKAMPVNHLPAVHVVPYKPTGAVQANVTDHPLICTGQDGKGRTAMFTWLPGSNGLTPYMDMNSASPYPYHEYFFSMLIKAVRWASRGEPSIALNDLQWKDGGLIAQITSRNEHPQDVVFEIGVKHESNTFLKSVQIPAEIKPGANKINLPLDVKLLDGTNFADVRILAGEKVADFGSTAVVYTAPGRIESVTVKDDIYPSGKAIPVQVKTTCKDKNLKLLAELREKNGRLIARQELTVPEGTNDLPISLTPAAIYDYSGRLQLSLMDGERLLARQNQDLLLRPEHLVHRNWDSYKVSLGFPERTTFGFPRYLHDMRAATLKELGVNSVLFSVTTALEEKGRFHYPQGFDVVAESFARVNKRVTPGYKHECFDYMGGRYRVFNETLQNYAKTGDKKYLRRNPCLENHGYRQDYRKEVKQLVEQLQKWRPVTYDIGDESSYTRHTNQIDFDFSPSALIGFRKWLRGQYKSLAELNRSWGSKFKSWDKVTPPTSKEARKSGRYAGWADHRSYNEFVYADFLKYIIEILKDVDPKAAASISGTQLPKAYGGWDWTMLMPLFDTLNAYTHGGLAPIYRSFNHVPLMSWVGYGSSFDGMNSKVWTDAFNGHYGTAIYDENVVLNPDMTLTRCGRDMAEVLRPLLRGCGTLLQSTKPVKPVVIAIHYSQPSVHAAWIDQGEQKFIQTRIGWLTALDDNEFTYEFISYGDIEKGKLKDKGYQALVLPMSEALSDKEVSEITSFVKDGGVLLADVLPGKYDEHCAPRQRPEIQALFDENKNAFLVGTPMANYCHETTGERNSQMVSRMKAIFAFSSLPRAKSVVSVPGTGVQKFTFHLGDRGTLIGLISKNDVEVSLLDFKKLHFYDVIHEKPVTERKVRIKASQPVLLAILPYDPGKLQMKVNRTSNPDCVEITAGFDNTRDGDMHVLRFEVKDPDGRVVPMYSKIIPAPGGKAGHTFSPGLDESKSQWTVTVTDVVTGRSVSRKIHE